MGHAERLKHKELGMVRRIRFEGTPEHTIFYRLLFEAFSSRGTASREKRVDNKDLRSDAKILRGLKSVGTPIGNAPEAGELDGRPLKMREGGGYFDIDQLEHNRLMDFIKETQWMAVIADVAIEMQDWFDTAEKDPADAEAATGPRPAPASGKKSH